MRLLILALAVATAQAVVAAEKAEKAEKAESDAEARKNLVGVWKGRVDDGATGHVLKFTAKSISGTKDGRQDLGTGIFKLDLTATPWHMDAKGTKGAQKGRTYLGIYALEEDILKWCVSLPGAQRPTEFATKEGQFLLILKRQKEKGKEK